MTMTMEETAITTLTLAEQRHAARNRLTDPPIVRGEAFNIPAGYRVVEDSVPTVATSEAFLVTALESDVELARAVLLGIAVPYVQASTNGQQWFSPSRHGGVPSVYVKGAWVRRGVVDAPADKDMLVCFADGTIGQWYWNAERRLGSPRRSLVVVLEGGVHTTREGGGMDFNSRDWVPVERITEDPETSLQPAPVELAPYPNECSAESPMLGLAVSTTPALNPEMEPGSEYVAWPKGWTPGQSSVLLQCCRSSEGETVVFNTATCRGTQDGPIYLSRPSQYAISMITLRDSYLWVKAATSPVVHPEGPVAPEVSSATALMEVRKGLYSDALNELADDRDWCSEYEAVVQPLGYPGREESAKDYAVTLEVTFEMEDSSPSTRTDRTVESEVFSGNVSSLSLTNMTFSGTLNFTMTARQVTPARGSGSFDDRLSAALSDHITDTDVESALEALLTGSFNVIEYSIDSYEEDDD